MRVSLDEIPSRPIPPEPWSEGEKIPWDEPGFSERMLAEHLSQVHDMASRRVEVIDAQVELIHRRVLNGQAARVLDLGCGPGLYAQRIARVGHQVTGIDFSPASIRHARGEAEAAGLAIDYRLGDVREAEFEGPYDLAMFLFGELNVFRREEAAALLKRAVDALAPGGRVLIEPSTFDAVRATGDQPPRTSQMESGLFSPRPHQLLEETFWLEDAAVAVHRWFVIDRDSDEVERHADTTAAYTDGELRGLLERAGCAGVEQISDWPLPEGQQGRLVAYLGARGD